QGFVRGHICFRRAIAARGHLQLRRHLEFCRRLELRRHLLLRFVSSATGAPPLGRSRPPSRWLLLLLFHVYEFQLDIVAASSFGKILTPVGGVESSKRI